MATCGVAEGARTAAGVSPRSRRSASKVGPIGRRGCAHSREKGAFRPASTDERGDGSTATSSSDDPASFLREFADVALKMQTAALEGVADVPAQLAKQLQRAAAPPPQGFPPGPAGEIQPATARGAGNPRTRLRWPRQRPKPDRSAKQPMTTVDTHSP